MAHSTVGRQQLNLSLVSSDGGQTLGRQSMRVSSSILFVCALASATSYGGQLTTAVALEKLIKAYPKTSWSPTPVRIDIDCDGKPDYAFIAQTTKKVWVGVVRGQENAPVSMLSFGESPTSQDGLCYLPAKIEIESLDYDPTDAVGELPGFTRSRICTSFKLSGGECDSFHFFWNKNTNLLEWWRL